MIPDGGGGIFFKKLSFLGLIFEFFHFSVQMHLLKRKQCMLSNNKIVNRAKNHMRMTTSIETHEHCCRIKSKHYSNGRLVIWL